jgi:restriction endonuclease S subunits-like
MNRYERYKDSGIPWLGEVPEHWNVKRLKFLAKIQNGTDYKHVETNDGYPVIGSGGQFAFANSYLYDGESVLLGRKGTIDKPLYVKGAFWTVDTMYYTEILKNTYPKYFYYLTLTIDFGRYSTQTALPSMTQTALNNLIFAVPNYAEQTAIAHYLDTKLGEIDALIDKQQTLLEKLAEQRTAVITQAVTKGLNPAAPMKNSGVEWLGDVPAHWEVKRLRFTLSLNPVKSELNIPEDTLVSFVPMEAVNFDKDLTLSEERNLDEVYKGYTYFKNGDVVLAKITPCFENGKSAIAQNLTNGIAFGTTELHVLRSQDSINNHFLYYLIKSDSFMKIGESEMYGAGGQKRVPEEFIKNFLIGLPPYYEQVTIADYLDQETAKIDRLCETVNQTIGRLKEYRTALITQAVTGKIKVTDE